MAMGRIPVVRGEGMRERELDLEIVREARERDVRAERGIVRVVRLVRVRLVRLVLEVDRRTGGVAEGRARGLMSCGTGGSSRDRRPFSLVGKIYNL